MGNKDIPRRVSFESNTWVTNYKLPWSRRVSFESNTWVTKTFHAPAPTTLPTAWGTPFLRAAIALFLY